MTGDKMVTREAFDHFKFYPILFSSNINPSIEVVRFLISVTVLLLGFPPHPIVKKTHRSPSLVPKKYVGEPARYKYKYTNTQMQIPLLCLSYLAPCGFGGTTGRESVLEFVPRAGPCPLVGLAWVISIIVSDFIGNPCKCISSDEKSFQIYQLMKKPPLCWQPSASSPHHSHSSAAPAKTQFFCLQYFSVSYLSDDGCHPLLVDALAHSFVLQMVRCVSSGG